MITAGTILIEKGTLLPEPLRLENESYPSTWMPVQNSPDPFGLERQLNAAGWTFFYMASEISTTAFGFDRGKMIRAALRRIITKVRLPMCNCLEIDEVATHSFLGLPYVSVSAHSRHIQKGRVFSGK